METITPTFFIEKILFDHLPEKRELIKDVIDKHDFGKIIEGIIANISNLLIPTGNDKANPQEITAYAFKAIREINTRVVEIENPDDKAEIQSLLADFFNAVIKEIGLKKQGLTEQLNREIVEGVRLAAQLEGYDETDIFERIELLTLPTALVETIGTPPLETIQPTLYTTILSTSELKFLGELLQQHGIACYKVQFKNLFSKDRKKLIPVVCKNEKQLHFIHFMYRLVRDLKWVSIENATVWEGIKESFVDQNKDTFGKEIKQFYHRKIKKTEANDLIVKEIDVILKDFFVRFSDRKRTQSGPT